MGVQEAVLIEGDHLCAARPVTPHSAIYGSPLSAGLQVGRSGAHRKHIANGSPSHRGTPTPRPMGPMGSHVGAEEAGLATTDGVVELDVSGIENAINLTRDPHHVVEHLF